MSTNPAAVGRFTQLYDVYRAADALARDPRIDSARIAILGSSAGGMASLYSAMTRFEEAFGAKGATIVARVAFYPLCNFELQGELDVVEGPIRVFHGAKDDWAPIAPCQDYIERLQAVAADATITVYPDARHNFDNVSSPALNTYPDGVTTRHCMRREQNGQLVNVGTGRPFSFQDACVEYGPTTQYNDAASTAAQKAVKSLLEDVFDLSAAP
ncbi:dienelactone hydrolase family protein [Paracoccus sp. PAR01]|uniref:dienelactone hydrolase family protein n=1 Tax=Paracoccus sp. PAR01 TaxID=2769282 RepID=UPI00351C7CA0